jgi:hypothetical protein
MSTWTHFWDMSSGGGRKEPQNHIYIEAPEDEADVLVIHADEITSDERTTPVPPEGYVWL